MFAKAKEKLDGGRTVVRSTASGEKGAMPSIVGPDMTVTGNLDTPGEVHVEGRIDGDVTCSRLVVGPGGNIRGRVVASSAKVHGRVEGAIVADEVYLLSGSEVLGDVIQDSLEIAPGARFEGAVRRRTGGTLPQLDLTGHSREATPPATVAAAAEPARERSLEALPAPVMPVEVPAEAAPVAVVAAPEAVAPNTDAPVADVTVEEPVKGAKGKAVRPAAETPARTESEKVAAE